MTRIGDQLVRRGLIEQAALEKALRQQAKEGGLLGQHLVDGGFISRQQFYDGLAQQWDLERRDLDLRPPDPELVGRVDLTRDLALGWVPCEITPDGHVLVATSVRPGPDLVEEVREQFPAVPVRFVACTRRDLDHLAVRLRRRPRPTVGAAPSSGATVWCRSLAVRDLLGGLVVVLLLTAIVTVPPTVLADVLAVAGVAFLAAVVVQAWAAVLTAALDTASTDGAAGVAGGEEARVDDILLPTYSVLMAVGGRRGAVEQALARLAQIDYPTARTDVVLLVADDDTETLAAVRRAAPPSWVRVATHPAALAADPVAVYDDGLALARGRYVVALSPRESPDPDQLLRAVDAFEADLAENLAARRGRQPLAGLRVVRRVRGHRWSVANSLDDLDRTLLLDRAYPWRGTAADLRHELTSVHFNTQVLRRLGGWRAAIAGEVGAAGPVMRMARLDSTTRVPRPSLCSLVAERAVFVDRAVRSAAARATRLTLGEEPGSPRLLDVVLGFVSPALLLVYPVGVVASGALALRRAAVAPGNLGPGLAGVAALALGVVLATGVAAVLGVRSRGWPGLGQAILLPAFWLVHAAAAWYTALVLLPCRRSDRPASPVSDASGQRA